jgi:3-oxoacyl-[acyl-carrier protein] reductase
MQPIEQMSVIVTGGGSGIGAETARLFVDGGARVTICGRRTDKVTAVAADLGTACLAVTADVTKALDRARLVHDALAHGGDRLDVVVHAAANMYAGPVEELEEDRLLDLFHANVVGPMMLTGLCAGHLERTQGAVILFGSVHTRRAFPGASPYAATKGAVETLTRVLAAELGSRGIRVSCIRPGGVLTELNQRAGMFDDEAARKRLDGLAPAHALGRIGTAREVAEGVAYLATAQWTTGDVLVVDGGLGLGVTRA